MISERRRESISQVAKLLKRRGKYADRRADTKLTAAIRRRARDWNISHAEALAKLLARKTTVAAPPAETRA